MIDEYTWKLAVSSLEEQQLEAYLYTHTVKGNMYECKKYKFVDGKYVLEGEWLTPISEQKYTVENTEGFVAYTDDSRSYYATEDPFNTPCSIAVIMDLPKKDDNESRNNE